jgi:hypothetical protein
MARTTSKRNAPIPYVHCDDKVYVDVVRLMGCRCEARAAAIAQRCGMFRCFRTLSADQSAGG